MSIGFSSFYSVLCGFLPLLSVKYPPFRETPTYTNSDSNKKYSIG